ncbi:MAG TPA: dihydrolipoyl dehydrogenase [Candidatus Kryptonia bacterium]|nr:dihydrolipoyl dehydrogenase [Candidatus Kryptonia bacterium]
MPEQSYDLIVIGAGPGGYQAAIRAAQLGMRVGCVEKDPTLGGTCLNVGCIPSKALLESTELYTHTAHGLKQHGITVGQVGVDLAAMMTRKNKVVTILTKGIAGLFRKNKIEWINGTGRLIDANTVDVQSADGAQRITAKRILIASGSAPISLPALPFDGERIVSSTEALALSQIPQRLLVVGGGAIGLELGSVWRRLGSEVLVVEFMDRILPGTDREIGAELKKALEKQGLSFRLNTSATHAERDGDRMRVTLDSAGKTSSETADVVLVAVGRRPYHEGLGTLEAGITVDERGRIIVDEHFATSVPGVYAIGDVIAGPMLAHKAEEEGVAAVEMMAGVAGHVNYAAIPNVVYTWPELASVGLSEEEAAARGIAVNIGRFPFIANSRARCADETAGLVKMLADAKTDRIVGIHIVGPHASELIAEAAVAMEFGASAEDIARSVHAHPTLSETLKEAARAVDKRAINI